MQELVEQKPSFLDKKKTIGEVFAAQYNATKYGLRSEAKDVLLADELASDWEELKRKTRENLRPTDFIQEQLVLEIAFSFLRLSRAKRAELKVIRGSLSINDYFEKTNFLPTFENEAITRLGNYESRIFGHLRKNLKLLKELQGG